MKKILFIVGSLRQNSFNKQLSEFVAKELKGKAEVSYLDYSKLPLMNQDIERDDLQVIQEIRKQIKEADLLWVFSPIYNKNMPGGLKNLFDWLSRALDKNNPKGESAIHNKKVTVSSVAAGGFDYLFNSFTDLLKFIRTNVVGEFSDIPVNPEAWNTGNITLSPESIHKIEKQISAVLEN